MSQAYIWDSRWPQTFISEYLRKRITYQVVFSLLPEFIAHCNEMSNLSLRGTIKKFSAKLQQPPAFQDRKTPTPKQQASEEPMVHE